MARKRGAASNPAPRFAAHAFEPDPDAAGHGEATEPGTRFVTDASRSIISRNTSPDIPFDASLNPYRGCEHGCSYCYARPSHEYLGLSAGLDFERVIFVKENAAALLEAELRRPSWKPQLLQLSGITDPYQPVERRSRVTRACLEVLLQFRNPVGVITKNHLVTRDTDLLARLAEQQLTYVSVSLTTLEEPLRRVMEPRTATAERRLAAMRQLSGAGVPVHASIAPVIPGLNDHELPALLEAAAEAGAQSASYTVLRLPGAVERIFTDWLEEEFPDRRDKVLGRIREMRGGKLNNSGFGQRMRGHGTYAEQLRGLFRLGLRRAGLSADRPVPELRTDLFRIPGSSEQPRLF
ncbi:MAG TPA: PA0069 family radical SAM protein [Deinococcales bacterium]|nr:PA0069 family radical SAM protein [Deinococcales bacterium]